MKVREKEIGFLWNVGAFCDYSDWFVANKGRSGATAEMVKAEYMSRAYAEANGTKEFLTVADQRKLMPYEFEEIIKSTRQAQAEGEKRQIETVEAPKKKEPKEQK